MGRDKALLEGADGKNMLERSCGLGERVLIALAQDSESLYVSGDYADWKCIPDLVPERGPLGGVHSALLQTLQSKIAVDYLLFIPVDMPVLEVSTLTRLIDSCATASAAHYRGFELPFVIRVERDTAQLLTERLEAREPKSPSHSVRGLLRELSAVIIEPEETQKDEFFNMNSHAEFELWCVEGGR